MVFSACGKKASEKKSRVVTVRNVSLAVPEALPGEVHLAVTGAGVVPPPMQRITPRVAEHVAILAGVDFRRTADAPLTEPAQLTLDLDPSTLPAGRTVSSVLAVSLEPTGNLATLVPTVVGNKLTVTLPQLGAVLFVTSVPGALLLGTPGLVLGGTSKILAAADCPGWIAPDAPQTAAIAKDPAKFSIDDKKTLRLVPPLTVTEIDESGQSRTSEEILKRGSGDAINASVVYASLLAAKGYSVRLAGGHAVYKRGELVHKGFHQWAEAIIDGTPYYVETLDGEPRLIPVTEAREQRQLKVHRTCARTAPGVTGDPFETVDATIR